MSAADACDAHVKRDLWIWKETYSIDVLARLTFEHGEKIACVPWAVLVRATRMLKETYTFKKRRISGVLALVWHSSAEKDVHVCCKCRGCVQDICQKRPMHLIRDWSTMERDLWARLEKTSFSDLWADKFVSISMSVSFVGLFWCVQVSFVGLFSEIQVSYDTCIVPQGRQLNREVSANISDKSFVKETAIIWKET